MAEESFEEEYTIREIHDRTALMLSTTSDTYMWPEWGQSIDLAMTDGFDQIVFELTQEQAVNLARKLLEFSRVVSNNNDSLKNNSGEVE